MGSDFHCRKPGQYIPTNLNPRDPNVSIACPSHLRLESKSTLCSYSLRSSKIPPAASSFLESFHESALTASTTRLGKPAKPCPAALLCLNLNAVSPYDVWLSRWRRSDGELDTAAGVYPCLAGHFRVGIGSCMSPHGRVVSEQVGRSYTSKLPRSFGRRLP